MVIKISHTNKYENYPWTRAARSTTSTKAKNITEKIKKKRNTLENKENSARFVLLPNTKKEKTTIVKWNQQQWQLQQHHYHQQQNSLRIRGFQDKQLTYAGCWYSCRKAVCIKGDGSLRSPDEVIGLTCAHTKMHNSV